MPRIVQQVVSISYSPFPALPAPKVAGLLPASVPNRIEAHQLVIDFLPSQPLAEFERIRSIEEMDAEIAPLVFAAMESTYRLYQFRAERSRRQ